MSELLLTLDPRADTVTVHVRSSTLGEALAAPVDAQVLTRLGERAARSIASGARLQDLEEVGRDLFALVFEGDRRDLFQRARQDALSRNHLLTLRVEAPAASSLQGVPWEVMAADRYPLALDPAISLVRYPLLPEAQLELGLGAPARLLLSTACPKGQPQLDASAHERALRSGIAGLAGSFDVTVVPDASLRALDDALRKGRLERRPYRIWHHYGHGGRVERPEPGFRLVLEGEGFERYPGLDRLLALFQPGELHLAVVVACHSGSAWGLAPALAQASVAASVGFAGQVTERAAHRFTEVLYQSLSALPVEQAVGEARRALRALGDTSDWALPQLFARCALGRPLLRPTGPATGMARPAPQDLRQLRLESIVADLDRRLASGYPKGR